MLAVVDAVMQADGTMLAQQVRSVMAGSGMMGGGVVTGITGNPATPVDHHRAGRRRKWDDGVLSRRGTTINVSSSTPYVIHSDGVDLTGLPFTPGFDPTTVFKGQRIHAISGQTTMGTGMGGMMTGTINASEIDLEQGG